MGNNHSFFQCSKTSKTLFNPKTPQSSSLNIMRKSKSSISEPQIAIPLNLALFQTHTETDSQSFSTATPSNSQFSSNQHIKNLENYIIERKICDVSRSSIMLIRCKKDRSQLYVLKIIDKLGFGSQNADIYLQYMVSIPSNPYLIELKQCFLCNSSLYLIMEYCPGGCFLDVLRSQKHLSEDVARFYLAEMILGLETLFSLAFHRFLTTEDLLLDLEGHIKISNFGGEKQIYDGFELSDEESEEQNNGQFQDKYLKLTKEKIKSLNIESFIYLAPEMLEKDPKSTRNCDFWLLGILLYQMIVGEPPFSLRKSLENGFDLEKLKRILKETEPKFPKGISEECKGLIWSFLRKSPTDRIGAKSFKEIKNHRFFEGFPWKEVANKQIPAPFSSNLQVNCLKKKEEFRKFWKIQENLLKKPGVYLEKTLFIGNSTMN